MKNRNYVAIYRRVNRTTFIRILNVKLFNTVKCIFYIINLRVLR